MRDGDLHGGSGLEHSIAIRYFDPDLDGCRARIERWADEGYLALQGFVDAGYCHFGFVADVHLLGLALREVGFCEQRRDFHYGDERLTGGGDLAGEERPVGDDAVDGRADLGVADACLRALIFALRGEKLALGALDCGFAGDRFLRCEVLGGNVVGCLGLNERCGGCIEVASRDGALGEEGFAGVVDALLQIQIGFGLGDVLLGLLVVLGHRCLGCGCEGGLRLFVGALVVELSRCQVAVFEHCEELTGFHLRAALHVKLVDRSGDLGRDGGLRQRRQHGIRGDFLGQGLFGDGDGLDADLGCGSFFLRLAAGEQGACDKQGSCDTRGGVLDNAHNVLWFLPADHRGCLY